MGGLANTLNITEAIPHLPKGIQHLPKAIQQLPKAIQHLPEAVRHLPEAISPPSYSEDLLCRDNNGKSLKATMHSVLSTLVYTAFFTV